MPKMKLGYTNTIRDRYENTLSFFSSYKIQRRESFSTVDACRREIFLRPVISATIGIRKMIDKDCHQFAVDILNKMKEKNYSQMTIKRFEDDIEIILNFYRSTSYQIEVPMQRYIEQQNF